MRGPGTRGPYQNGVERRRTIVLAATAVFASEGYVGGSLRRIAAAADLSEPGVLKLFGSKSALLLATLAHWAPTLDLDGRTAREAVPCLDALPAWVATRQSLRDARRLMALITAEASTEGHPAHDFVVDRQIRQTKRVTELLIRASTSGELAPMRTFEAGREARLIVTIMNGLETQWLIEPTLDMAALLGEYLETVVVRWSPIGESSVSAPDVDGAVVPLHRMSAASPYRTMTV